MPVRCVITTLGGLLLCGACAPSERDETTDPNLTGGSGGGSGGTASGSAGTGSSGDGGTATGDPDSGQSDGDEPGGTDTGAPPEDTDDPSDSGGIRLDVGDQGGSGAGEGGDNCGELCEDAVGTLPMGSWLLNFTTTGTFGMNPPEMSLHQVDVDTGNSVKLCDLSGGPLDFAGFGFKSATFTRDNRLMATDGAALFEVDPCACTYVRMGGFGNNGSIYGITPDEGNGLFGVSANSSNLVRINPDTGETTVVGPLGIGSFNQHGASWSAVDGVIYFVNDADDGVYTIDPATGAATFLVTLSSSISTVGAEIHPDTNALFVCGTADGVLGEVDKATGVITPRPSGPSVCTNLGAPWADGGSVCVPPVG